MNELDELLRRHGIRYERIDHPPVYTCAEAERLVPTSGGAQLKNLFLRDKRGTRHFLVITLADKQVDLKALSAWLAADRLSFASPERLARYLGVEPGGVSILALIRDQECAVEIAIDVAVWDAAAWRCHPLVNTATLVIAREGIERFLAALGREYRLVEVPDLSRSPS